MREIGDSAVGRESRPPEPDVVFDFSGMGGPDLYAICVVLTARMHLGLEDRRVWLHALPERTWHLLGALNLQHYFEVLPDGGNLLD